MLTQKKLNQLLYYDPLTGMFMWYERKNGCRPPTYNAVAGSPSTGGYIQIVIVGKSYKASRLAWFYMTGKWPKHEVDHIKKPVSNNAWANLREATHQQNGKNLVKGKDSTSGYKGVSWHKGTQKWRAKITANKVDCWLGLFDTPQEAHAAYCKEALIVHGNFARFN